MVVLIWALAYRLVAGAAPLNLPDFGALATLLFGASSLALVVYSVLTSVLAFFGWQAIKDSIRDSVETVTRERLQALEHEMRGRVLSGLGYMIGELSTNPETFEPTNPERLSMAVDLCERGYRELKRAGEIPELNGLNNLVYYQALRGLRADGSFLLEKARLLRTRGQELGATHLLLTYCAVVLKYSQDAAERKEAADVVADLTKRNIPEREMKEARIYLATFQNEAGN